MSPDRPIGQAPVPEHLRRRGLRDLRLQDPQLKYQTTLLRDFIGVAEMAMIDEGVDGRTIARVINLIVYGMTPCRADVEARMETMDRLTDYVGNGPLPPIQEYLEGLKNETPGDI